GIRDRNVTGVQTCALPLVQSRSTKSIKTSQPMKSAKYSSQRICTTICRMISNKYRLNPVSITQGLTLQWGKRKATTVRLLPSVRIGIRVEGMSLMYTKANYTQKSLWKLL